jgi:hypothetical protein
MVDKTRAEHLAWCKQRALEYVATGDLTAAMASMGSDLGKHPETANHPGIKLGLLLAMGGFMSNQVQVQKWIEGFN